MAKSNQAKKCTKRYIQQKTHARNGNTCCDLLNNDRNCFQASPAFLNNNSQWPSPNTTTILGESKFSLCLRGVGVKYLEEGRSFGKLLVYLLPNIINLLSKGRLLEMLLQQLYGRLDAILQIYEPIQFLKIHLTKRALKWSSKEGNKMPNSMQ